MNETVITSFILGIPTFFIWLIIDRYIEPMGFNIKVRVLTFVCYYLIAVSCVCHYQLNFFVWFK